MKEQLQALCPVKIFGNRLAWAAGKYLAVYNIDSKTIELDVNDCEGGHSDAIRAISFNHDGSMIATAGEDKRIVFWSLENSEWKPIQSFLHAKKIMTVDFESDSNDVVFGDKFGDFFRLKNMTEPEILFGHLAAVSSALMSNKRSLLVSADRDEKIRITQFPKYWNISSFLFGHKRYISGLSFFNAHETEIVSAGADGLVFLWDISNPDAPKKVWSVQLPEGPINSIAVKGEGEIYVLRADEPAVVTRIMDGKIVDAVELHADAQTVFTTPDGSLAFVDSKSHIRFLDEQQVRLAKDVDGVPISLMKFVHHENVDSGEFEDRKRQKTSE